MQRFLMDKSVASHLAGPLTIYMCTLKTALRLMGTCTVHILGKKYSNWTVVMLQLPNLVSNKFEPGKNFTG